MYVHHGTWYILGAQRVSRRITLGPRTYACVYIYIYIYLCVCSCLDTLGKSRVITRLLDKAANYPKPYTLEMG